MRWPSLTVALLLFITAAAQPTANSPLVLTHITEENGLSDNHITCVYKDKNEMLWVGTKDGLNLIDGSTISIFRNSRVDSSTIGNNFINSIIEDKKNNLWIATAGGLSVYDRRTNTFTNIGTDADNKPLGGVSNIAADDKNVLWFGTGGGLMSYDPSLHTIKRYFNNSTAFETDIRFSNRVNHVLISTDNKAWLCTSDGLWNFSIPDHTFTKIIHKQNDPHYEPLCLTAYEDDDKNIWAGFWNTGLKKIEPATGKITDYGGGLKYDHTVTHINILKPPDGKKYIWLNGKLQLLDPVSVNYFNLQPPITEHDLPDVDPVYLSDDGWIWLASDNGLYIYSPQSQVFHHQFFDAGITSQAIVFSKYKNGMLVGAQDKDFLKWRDNNGNLLKDYSSLSRNKTAMLCLVQDSPDDFWIGTTDGILHTDLATGSAKWFAHKDGDSTTLPRNFISTMFIDSKKNLWVFPWREGVWQMDKQSGICKRMLDGFIMDNGERKKLLISDAAEDAAGNIWMADLDEGIVLYDVASKQFSKPFEKVTGERVRTSRVFVRGEWVYSSFPYAIVKWNIHDRKLVQFLPPGELNKPIKDIYPDNNGNWWLATANGLMIFNEKEKTFRKFTTADGLYQNDVDGNLFCTSDGNMVIGAPAYLSFFQPEQLTGLSTVRKNIKLISFLANDLPVDIGENRTISLSHSQNNILIRWALPAYANPLKNHYYCQLQGIDSGWRYIGNKGEVQYANLSQGKYTILLKATTSNETESNNIERIIFIIRPPYWKTWWFITLVIIAVSSLFFALVRYISQRNLKEKLLKLEKEQAVEKERNRISRDMHDDLGSGLTKIAIMSEVVKKQMNEPDKAREQLENISHSSRELIDNLQDIIWVLNPRNDTLDSLAAYIREYALKFFEPFGITVHFDYPEKFSEVKLSEETRRNIFLVIKETFNNTAKYAWCDNVTVSISYQAPTIHIVLGDDGKGFDTSNTRQFGNGLINMKNRIEQIGGVYAIRSGPGKGTTIEIDVMTVK